MTVIRVIPAEPLPNNGRYQILDSGRTLRISHVQMSDSDVYVCRAESAAGRMEAQADLQIIAQCEAPIALVFI